jgi:hypothetical protein
MKTFIAVLFACTVIGSSAFAGSGTKIQCWTDDEGQRACGDSVPPKYSHKEREIINEQGVLVEQKPRARTPEERVEEENERKRVAEEARKAERQHAYDRYLLESYQSVSDLEKTREERVKALETRMEIVQRAIESGQAQLDALVARKQSLQKGNFPPDKRLEQQIKEYRRAIIENPKALQQLKLERERIITQFDSDIARYQELTHSAASATP